MRRDLTPEERKAHGAAIRAGWAKKSPEEREAFRQRCRDARAATRAAREAAGTLAPARAVKGSRDAKTVRVVAGNDGAAMPTAVTPLGRAVADARRAGEALGEAARELRELVPSRMECDVVSAGPLTLEWTDWNGAPLSGARTNGDLGRHLGALLDGVACRIADQVAARVASLHAPAAGADPLRARLLDLARQVVALAHADRKSVAWLRQADRVAAAALGLEPHLPASGSGR